MRKKAIEDLRIYFFEKVKNYEGNKPLKFDLSQDVLQSILFDYNEEEGVKTFSTEDEEILAKIDFSNVSFEDFDCRHFDFTGLHGVRIIPKLAFEQSLEFSILNGVEIYGDFNDVCIRGADFSGITGYDKIDPYEVKERDLSYCTLNGIEFIGSFQDAIITGADFTGSKGAVIDPQLLKSRDLTECVFANVEFKETSFYGCEIVGADFTGSHGAVINPGIILNRSLFCTKLAGTEIIGPFHDVYIAGTDFTGSDGAKIDPQVLRDNSLFNAKLCDVKFIGGFDGCNLSRADFTGSTGAVIENPETCTITKETNFTDAFVTDLKAEKIEKDKIKRKIRDTLKKSTK